MTSCHCPALAGGARCSASSPVSPALLQALPLAAVLGVFLLVPMVSLIVVSFFDYDSVQIIPGFVLTNYRDVLFSATTWWTYLETLKFTAIVWALTLLIGFWVAYFLAFVVRSRTVQTDAVPGLHDPVPDLQHHPHDLLGAVPRPQRAAEPALLRIGMIRAPLEFLLFSDFAVVLAFVHLYTLFMVAPIFNTMVRIDRRLIEAAIDGGARPWRVLAEVIIPLSKPGIAIGSIFVVTLVMGDFITVRLMSGGQSASVGLMISNEMSLLQYPAAAANAVVLLAVVLLMVAAIVRVVDVRKEL